MPTAAPAKKRPTTAEPEEPKAAIESPDPKHAEPVGRSSSKPERATWEHDGKFYEIRVLGDFGIGEQQSLNRDGREFYQLWTSETELTEDQGKRLKMILERMFAKVLDAPRTVQRTFDDAAKADVVLHFTLAPLRRAMLAVAQQEAENQQAQDGLSTSTT